MSSVGFDDNFETEHASSEENGVDYGEFEPSAHHEALSEGDGDDGNGENDFAIPGFLRG
jgi:hypothetical protein